MWKPSRLSKHINKRLGKIVASSYFTSSASGEHSARPSLLSKVGRQAAFLSDLLSAAGGDDDESIKDGQVTLRISSGLNCIFGILTVTLGFVEKYTILSGRVSFLIFHISHCMYSSM